MRAVRGWSWRTTMSTGSPEQIQAAAKGVVGQYALVVTVPDEK